MIINQDASGILNDCCNYKKRQTQQAERVDQSIGDEGFVCSNDPAGLFEDLGCYEGCDSCDHFGNHKGCFALFTGVL